MSRLKGMILLIGIVLALFIVPMVAANIVISEIMYNPNDTSQGSDDYNEWIELHNNGAESINLSKWSVCVKDLLMGYVDRNGSIHLNASFMLASGGYAIITDGGSGTEVYDNFVVDSSSIALHTEVSTICGGLNNTGGTISVKDGAETIVMYYGSWGANGNGKSLQLASGSWCEGPPTPGAANVCQYCGDTNCDADESCANCSADCKKCNSESCSDASECSGNYCVHSICRSSSTYCSDSYCDTGENCPSDNASCTDIKCYEPTCVNGCGQTAVASNGTDEACNSTAGCSSPPCQCNGAGNCVSTTTPHSCGDETCDTDENCANCSTDCPTGTGKVCCNGTIYTGNCCVNANCTSPKTCVNHNCTTPTHYCGDGTCDTNETCSCSDCEGKRDGGTSKQLCCSGSYTDLCFSSSDCPSEKACRNAGTCNATCVNASTIVCNLNISISAEIFNVSITQNYYLHINDTKGNYTGSAVVTYWIEDSNGTYIRYHTPNNATVDVNINKSRDYTPLEICGNATYYIKAEITDPKCNDTNLTNNAVIKVITIWGLDTNSAECFKNLTYGLEIPAQVKAEENFTVSVDIENKQNVSQVLEIWSYVYRWGKCYSCYGNETEESNKQVISIPAKSSLIVELQNKVNATNGTYYIKVKILKEGFSTPEEFTYDVEVKEKEKIEINETVEAETNETEGNATGGVIYESKSRKVNRIIIYILPALLLAAAIYFAVVRREQISRFVASKYNSLKEHITSKKQELGKKKEWRKYIKERRPGVIKRLSKGFVKPKA